MATKMRLTVAERSKEVLRAAIHAFGASGYAGTKTGEIARLAGVSQPYVIRLFGTKQQLFLAAVQAVCDTIEQTFRQAADEMADLESIAAAYETLMVDREMLLVLLHGFSAGAESAIGDTVRERFGGIYRLVRELTGVSPIEARDFLATGMLRTMLSALRISDPAAPSLPWGEELNCTFLNDPRTPS
ncbi:TetR/AcrR family transcriptional regulator [Kribbella sp. NPDC004138]